MTTKRSTHPVDRGSALRAVPIELIDPDPNNERRNLRNVEELASSIKLVGVIEPITVTQHGEKYTVCTGHRRLEAARTAGLKEMEVIVREEKDEFEQRRTSLISNIQREDLNAIDLADALVALYGDGEEFGTQSKFADAIGKSDTWVSDILTINKLPLDLREKLRASEKHIPYDSVIKIARIKNPQKQANLVDRVLGGATTQEVRKSIADGKKGQSTARESVKLDLYEAIVTGPQNPSAHEYMVAAVEALLEKLRTNAQQAAS